MRDLMRIAKECMNELDAIKVPYRKVERFEVGNRAVWGYCKAVAPGRYIISISNKLLDDTTDIKGLKNTIIHELIHTCEGCMNHKAEWKKWAAKVNETYGYNIQRTESAEEKGVSEKVMEKGFKHKYVCECCGQVVLRQRDRGFELKYDCSCGGNFKKVF